MQLSLVLSLMLLKMTLAYAQTGSDSLPAWIIPDSAARSVALNLEVTHPRGATTASLNGEHNGSVQVNVPAGWTVRWHWHNADSAAHSLVVMAEREKIPLEGGQPALDQAATRAVTTGLPGGTKEETTFVADQPGWYWILCGVPNHALAGEWIGLRIDPEASQISIKRKARE